MEKKIKELKFSKRVDFVKDCLKYYEENKNIKEVFIKYNGVKNLLTYEYSNGVKKWSVSEKFTIVFNCFAISQTIYLSNIDGTQQTINTTLFVESNEILLTDSLDDLNLKIE